MAVESVINMREQTRHASVGEQLTLPVPTHAPARPMNDTTPSLESGVPFSTTASHAESSTPSMVENTLVADCLIESTKRS